ncbi:Protein of unknown function [Polaribacter dokdonensis DSW-5]|uniref:DUF2975 domain-containing protein n=3 Tax=Polaribacter TaxID=52959 RepID=A0A1H5F0G4_9FLAO|nr:Protein of unknown function [Polaribacter dokdonensis DSW-5]
MKTTNKLKIASYFLKFLMSIQIIICLGLIFVYFHSMTAPENYNSLTINTNRDLIFNFDVNEIPKTYDDWKETNQLYHFNLLNNYSKAYVIWSKVIMFTGFFFILFLLNKLLKNTESFNFFFEKNIKIINNIIYLIITLFILNFLLKGFTIKPLLMAFDNNTSHFLTKRSASLNFVFYYPLAIIFFSILKVVFKRGQELKQENDLTI